ncbi:zinc finger protein 385D isoform X2 [Diachasma alloeum]|uniref:zinc finger protein 385D isoform X2 n=1 Tax=Diachasma alloeum TaxID=454923 RepID=UPI0007381F48|nr:zinc finger protein 385D isoform X2 [Diachasma alloeum]
MSTRKSIENPEVPGLEENLPPPLPPLPPEKIAEPPIPAGLPSENKAIVPQVNPPIIPNIPPQMNPHDLPSSHVMPPLPYMPPPVPQPPVGQMVPWWVPIDADSTGIYSQWSENQTETFAPEINNESGATNFKRKAEQVDPAKDAEKVASAQSELSALMKPLRCDLCNAVMNSTLQAKLHYEGKPHQKKVSMFLNQSVKKLKTDEGPITTTSSDWSSYCDVCKTWFTSQADASQHYAGKKHLRATTGAPKKKSPKKGSVPPVPVDPTGRFGIGAGFQLEAQGPSIVPEAVESVVPLIPNLPNSQMYNPAATTYSGALRCDLCGVTANRLEQLETHKRGIRHQKMLRLNGVIPTETVTPTEHVVTATTIDYSICRTPSGSYYCAPCDKSFTSENSFAQHVESKKHKNQVNPKPAGTQAQKLSSQDKHKKHK